MFSPIQIVLVLFALFALTRVFMKLRARGIPAVFGVLWGLLWVGVAVVTLLPQTTDWFARTVGVERGADLIVYLSIVALLYAVFRLVLKQESLEQHITQLVRHHALRDLPKDVSSHSNKKI